MKLSPSKITAFPHTQNVLMVYTYFGNCVHTIPHEISILKPRFHTEICSSMLLHMDHERPPEWGPLYMMPRVDMVFLSSLPVYSGKQIVSGDFLIFSSNKSFLLRKRMMDVSVNHLLLQIESNSFKLSCIRFCKKLKFLNISFKEVIALYPLR